MAGRSSCTAYSAIGRRAAATRAASVCSGCSFETDRYAVLPLVVVAREEKCAADVFAAHRTQKPRGEREREWQRRIDDSGARMHTDNRGGETGDQRLFVWLADPFITGAQPVVTERRRHRLCYTTMLTATAPRQQRPRQYCSVGDIYCGDREDCEWADGQQSLRLQT
jgi:hypothetical protein